MADRVAVITGAGSGIGRASALALMNDGWSVALAGRRKEMLEETAGMKTGGRALVVPTDVTDPAQVDNLFAQIKSNFGRIDMLFNNAGGGTPTTNFGDFTYEMWHARRAGEPERDVPVRQCRVPHDARPVAARRTDHQQRLDLGACAAGGFRRLHLDQARGDRADQIDRARWPRVRHLLRSDRHRQRGDADDGALDQRADAAVRPDGGRAAHGREPCRRSRCCSCPTCRWS